MTSHARAAAGGSRARHRAVGRTLQRVAAPQRRAPSRQRGRRRRRRPCVGQSRVGPRGERLLDLLRRRQSELRARDQSLKRIATALALKVSQYSMPRVKAHSWRSVVTMKGRVGTLGWATQAEVDVQHAGDLRGKLRSQSWQGESTHRRRRRSRRRPRPNPRQRPGQRLARRAAVQFRRPRRVAPARSLIPLGQGWLYPVSTTFVTRGLHPWRCTGMRTPTRSSLEATLASRHTAKMCEGPARIAT